MPDLCSIVEPVNVQIMAASGVWTGLPIARLNNSQITDAVRLAIFANYGLTAAIEQSDDGVNWSSLYSQANTAAQLLDSGWLQVTKRYFHVKITNGGTAQGGDIYANPQFVNAGAIDAKLCLFMQEPETISGGTLALSGSITADYFAASATTNHTFIVPVTGFEISNDGANSLTFVLAYSAGSTSPTFTILPGEVSDEKYPLSASVVVTATGVFRAWGKV